MTAPAHHRIVLDCSVFARALINPRGPAGACVSHAQRGDFLLILSEYVLQELRELPRKIKASRGVTSDRVEALIRDISTNAEAISNVPDVFIHSVDADDSHYVNLALAASATHLLTNDIHLLSLADLTISWGVEFKSRYPHLDIVTPEVYCRRRALG